MKDVTNYQKKTPVDPVIKSIGQKHFLDFIFVFGDR